MTSSHGCVGAERMPTGSASEGRSTCRTPATRSGGSHGTGRAGRVPARGGAGEAFTAFGACGRRVTGACRVNRPEPLALGHEERTELGSSPQAPSSHQSIRRCEHLVGGSVLRPIAARPRSRTAGPAIMARMRTGGVDVSSQPAGRCRQPGRPGGQPPRHRTLVACRRRMLAPCGEQRQRLRRAGREPGRSGYGGRVSATRSRPTGGS